MKSSTVESPGAQSAHSLQTITILGATGSIGASTLDVIARHPDRYRVYALTCRSRIETLADQCLKFRPERAVVATREDAVKLAGLLGECAGRIEIGYGAAALEEVAREADTVMAAIVGAAGLPAVLAAVRAGRRILLANKEALVMGGALFMREVRLYQATLLPIDSEHNAIFQCLPESAPGQERRGIEKLVLTASGGPFRSLPLEQLAAVTPDQACAHPNWAMGRKISVDSATMMNKGLEVIEAHWLFDMPAAKIEVLIHPQSIVHSMVTYIDGSTLAQLGNPDMRTPIAYALGYPERIEAGVDALDLVKIDKLSFEAPDLRRFPSLGLAYAALRAGGTAPVILNASNEIAVEAFLCRRIPFTAIPQMIEQTLHTLSVFDPESFDEIFEADARARAVATSAVEAIS